MSPHQAQADTLKKIECHLKGVLNDGLVIDPKGDLSLDCCINANFAGNCDAKEVDNPATVQFCTGFAITLCSAPVPWQNMLQTEVTFHPGRHIAPSNVMHKLVHL